MPNLLIQKSMLPIVTNTIVDATKLQVPSLRSNHWLRHENNSLVRSITFPHLQLLLTQSGNGGSIFQTSIQQLSHPCWFSAHDIQVCFCLNHILMIPATPEDLLNDHSLHVPSSWMKEGGIAVGTRPPLLWKVKGVYSTPFTSILHPSDGLRSIFDRSCFLLAGKKNSACDPTRYVTSYSFYYFLVLLYTYQMVYNLCNLMKFPQISPPPSWPGKLLQQLHPVPRPLAPLPIYCTAGYLPEHVWIVRFGVGLVHIISPLLARKMVLVAVHGTSPSVPFEYLLQCWISTRWRPVCMIWCRSRTRRPSPPGQKNGSSGCIR